MKTKKHEKQQPHDDDVLPDAPAIAAILNRTVKSTYGLLEKGLLPAYKLNGKWTSTVGLIREHIRQEARANLRRPAAE